MFVLRKVVLYIAMSLDGYIADKNGSVDWLEGYDSGGSYSEFIKTVDTVIMGNTTYRQIITELSPNEWVYKGLAGYVITHDTSRKDENVTFYSGSPCALVEDIKRNSGGNIWICGGADIAEQLISGGLIDVKYLFFQQFKTYFPVGSCKQPYSSAQYHRDNGNVKYVITEVVYEKI